MEEDTGTWELEGLSERGEPGGRRSQTWKGDKEQCHQRQR